VADNGALAARQHRGDLPGAKWGDPMANQIDTAEHGVQPGGLEPVVDSTRRQPSQEQLRARDDAMLAGGELRD
jgi:hypothetical protein